MSAVIVIPARIASTRLPEKLLRDLGGKTVIQRTYEQAREARRAASVVIATDSEEIADKAKSFGAKAVMTRADHQSGSERVAEAATRLDADIIVNIQGDEPEIDPAHIDALIETQEIASLFASTLACPFPVDIDPAYSAAVKATLGLSIDEQRRIFEAADFSRAAPAAPFYLHVGAYAFSRDSLARFIALPRGKRERAESLEQLRILEAGEKIAVRIVDRAARGIDTIEDLEAARRRFSPN